MQQRTPHSVLAPALSTVLAGAILLTGCTAQTDPQPSPDPGATSTQTSASPGAPTPPATEGSATPAGTAAPVPAGDAATGLRAPWSVAVVSPTSALVSQRDSGEVVLLTATPTGWGSSLAGRVSGVVANGEGGLLGLAVAPSGDAVYAMFTGADGNRVVRMAWDGSALGPQTDIVTGIPKAEIHNGGRLAIGPDGALYIATGDAGRADAAQDPASLSGKILRVAADGSVPADNPTPGSPVYSLGHRNVQGLAFDETGRLWATEFGARDVDEVNLIVPGGNYGWPRLEGAGGVPGMIDPVVQWRPTAVASPSGATIAGGSLWVASLRGQTLYQMPLRGDGTLDAPIAHFTESHGRLRDVVVGPNGSLWLLTNNTDGRGQPRPGDDRIVEIGLTAAD